MMEFALPSVMNPCCVDKIGGGGCCTVVQVTMVMDEKNNIISCCCSANGFSLQGCCQVIPSFSGLNIGISAIEPNPKPSSCVSGCCSSEKDELKEELIENNEDECEQGCCGEDSEEKMKVEEKKECGRGCCGMEKEKKEEDEEERCEDDCCGKEREEEEGCEDDCCEKEKEAKEVKEEEKGGCEDNCCGERNKEEEEGCEDDCCRKEKEEEEGCEDDCCGKEKEEEEGCENDCCGKENNDCSVQEIKEIEIKKEEGCEDNCCGKKKEEECKEEEGCEDNCCGKEEEKERDEKKQDKGNEDDCCAKENEGKGGCEDKCCEVKQELKEIKETKIEMECGNGCCGKEKEDIRLIDNKIEEVCKDGCCSKEKANTIKEKKEEKQDSLNQKVCNSGCCSVKKEGTIKCDDEGSNCCGERYCCEKGEIKKNPIVAPKNKIQKTENLGCDDEGGCCGEVGCHESAKKENIKGECKSGCCGEIDTKSQNQIQQIKIEPKKDVACMKGCCEKEKIEDEAIKLEEEIINYESDDDAPLIKNSTKKNKANKNKNKNKNKKKEQVKEDCNKGCCGTETVAITKKEEDCNKGCCGTETVAKTKKEEEKKGGCCDSVCIDSPETIALCCSLCWNGGCCKQDCCDSSCCLSVSVSLAPPSAPTQSWWPPFSFSWSAHQWKPLQEEQEFTTMPSMTTESPSSLLSPSSSAEASLLVQIGGMTCTDCASSIETCLAKLPGVMESDITYITGKGRITYNEASVTQSKIIGQIEKLGFTAEEISLNGASETQFEISYPSYPFPKYADGLINSILKVKGVTEARLDVRAHILQITHDPDTVSPHRLAQCVREAGWTLLSNPSHTSSSGSKGGQEQVLWGWKWRFWLGTVLSLPVIISSYILPSVNSASKEFITQEVAPGLPLGILISWIFSTPIQFGIAACLYSGAYKSLRFARKANVDSLVMLSSSSAYLYSIVSVFVSLANGKPEGESFFETCAILLTLIMLGRFIETYAKEKTKKLLTKVVDVPQTCTVVNDNEDIEIEDVAWVGPGDVVRVVPGEKIAFDGVTIFGHSEVDESMLTGESMPVTKMVDSLIFSGSINLHGILHIRVTKRSQESALAKIRQLVEDAQSTRSHTQMLADTFASYFIPSILGLSLLTFIVWISVEPSNLAQAVRYAVCLLVVACPCALALAVPTAVMAGLEVGAREGVLMKKGGEAIEKLNKAQVFVFDKTGTLTRGHPIISYFSLSHSISPAVFFEIVGSAESRSEHPVGKAIVAYSKETMKCDVSSPVYDFNYTPGKGLVCKVADNDVCIGNEKWIIENGIEISALIANEMEARKQQGESVVYVGINRYFCGFISVIDSPKQDAKFVVEELERRGKEVWMISGDNVSTVATIGSQLGISNVIGGVLPAEKAIKVRELQASGKQVAMIGDGINDSPALAQADVGIAIGAGTDIAIEAAGVVLIKNDLLSVLAAIDLANKTHSRIAWNLGWAAVYNCIALLFASGAIHAIACAGETDCKNDWAQLPPSLAGASELISSVPVLIASALLHYYSPPKYNYQ